MCGWRDRVTHALALGVNTARRYLGSMFAGRQTVVRCRPKFNRSTAASKSRDRPLLRGVDITNLLTKIAGALPLGLSGLASAQGGTMMNGGMGGAGWMGGYGGYWGPVLLVVVVGLVAWVVMRGRK